MNRVRTKTGDIMHVTERNENDVTYGAISIILKCRYRNLHDAEQVLIQFMQQLQPIFIVQHTAGLHITRDAAQNTVATVDYWQDAEQKDWRVKGWTDGATVAVSYIKNIGTLTIDQEDLFLRKVFAA